MDNDVRSIFSSTDDTKGLNLQDLVSPPTLVVELERSICVCIMLVLDLVIGGRCL